MGMMSEADHKIVSDAVAAAELHTSGEIVPVIAEESDGYSDIALFWAAVASFTAMSVLVAFPDIATAKWDWLFAGNWGEHEWTLGQFASLVVGLGLLKFLGVWLILLIPRLRFWLVPGPIKSRRVRQRAIKHFKVGAERRTHGRSSSTLLPRTSMRAIGS